MNTQKHKPELLLPAGNVESFYAAIEGGADAIYLGTKLFNARERAANFSPQQLKAMVKHAHSQNVKIYVTLNTVIKNQEISELLYVLYQLQEIKPDALIIQDMAVWHIVQKHFPQFELHASTQMAHHNSLGAEFAKHIGIQRVIMARELNFYELQQISQKTKTELEIFVHGALCYAFSGMCLFSSYLGGMGANRGLCKQACRRVYHGKESGFHFSMKDNQLIDFVPEFARLGIRSIKIEGRMKPAEYVYRVAKAYRMVLDNPNQLDEAKHILELDLGREKTAWFMGGNVSESITQAPATGKLLGKIQSCESDYFTLATEMELIKSSRIRIFSPGVSEHQTFKIEGAETQNGICTIYKNNHKAKIGDDVYLAGIPEKQFPSKIQEKFQPMKSTISFRLKQKILKDLTLQQKEAKSIEIIVRINELAWLPKVDLREVKHLIINLSSKEWQSFDAKSGLVKKFANKIIIELPKFIPEGKISTYRELCKTMYQQGIHHFSLSHLSQKIIIPKGSILMANENIYSFSDSSIIAIKRNGIQDYIRPLENDFPNLLSGNDRFGIIPIYFHPHLFVSRMPVKTGESFHENDGRKYLHHVVDGVTFIIPEEPVSLTQYKNKLENKGFKRYLIDLSFTKVSSNRFKTIIKRLKQSEQIQPASNFNFKAEMK
ncbi:MAG: peptidase U32 family protein [Bacteroidota bacterium]|nr:peptidase U32 family protein [Bacteroidota bacterium]